MKKRRKTNKTRGGNPGRKKSKAQSKRQSPTRKRGAGATPPPPPAGPVAAAAPAGAGPSGSADTWDTSVSDTIVLNGQCAANAAQRHVVLDHALSNVWANEDIGMIQRVESSGRCMWVMWRRSSLPPS